jgi:hypothetical protein
MRIDTEERVTRLGLQMINTTVSTQPARKHCNATVQIPSQGLGRSAAASVKSRTVQPEPGRFRAGRTCAGLGTLASSQKSNTALFQPHCNCIATSSSPMAITQWETKLACAPCGCPIVYSKLVIGAPAHCPLSFQRDAWTMKVAIGRRSWLRWP